MKVATTQGEIERDLLEVKDAIEWGDNCRIVATEWRYHGALVRRDVHVIVLRPLQVGVKASQ